MKDKLNVLIITLVIFFTFSFSVNADFGISLDLNNSQTDNLMSNSSEYESPIRSGGLGLKYYPIHQLELSGTYKYTAYDEIYDSVVTQDAVITKTDIGNSLFGFGATWIPTKSENKTNLFFSLNYDRVSYKESNVDVVKSADSILYQDTYKFIDNIIYKDENVKAFDNAIITFKASIGYKYKPTIHLRAGTKFTNNNYLEEESTDADNLQYELFAGANFSLPGSNSLDIESGFGMTSLKAITIDAFPVEPKVGDILPSDYLDDDNIQNLYISPRLSRSIGKKTGVSITFTYRNFTNVDNSVILDYSTSFLSPWSSFYDGTSTVLNLKSYIVPTMVITAGAGYWDKTFLKAIEIYSDSTAEIDPRSGDTLGFNKIDMYTEPSESKYRFEWLTSLYVDLKRPIIFREFLIEPSFSVVYKKNSSTSDSYDYSSTTFSFGLSLSGNF